jgi:hypothetical protein
VIEHLSNFPANVLAFRCGGRVTKSEYDSVLTPTVVKALETSKKIRVYYETSADFEGIEAGAVWEDFRLGAEHLPQWERFAIVTDVGWIPQTMRLFSFLMPGVMRFYSTSDAAKARDWIVAES